MLSSAQIKTVLNKWYDSWNRHDLDDVMELLHEDILFVHWNGKKISGKKSLRRAWKSWFENHGGFQFVERDTFIDDDGQKALFQWRLEWPSDISEYEGMQEKREGVDILHLKDGKIIQKLTYSQTVITINGKEVLLSV